MIRPIDSHVHLYPPEVNSDPAGWAAAAGEAHWATLCVRRRRDGNPVQTFPSVDELLREMDGAGVERAVLLGWYWEKPATCLWQNRFYGECIRTHPDRLAAFATFHPSAGSAGVRTEIRRASEAGFRGLGELSPHSQGYAVDDPVFAESLALAAEFKLPVNLHVTDPEARSYPGRVATPLEDFLYLARAFPQTTFILAHWGGLLPIRHPGAAAQTNLFYDTAASPLYYDARVWTEMAAVAGAGRILFGSDFPLNIYPKLDPGPNLSRFLAEARGAGLGPAAESAIFRENIGRLLGSWQFLPENR